jgi:hypothetical protein
MQVRSAAMFRGLAIASVIALLAPAVIAPAGAAAATPTLESTTCTAGHWPAGVQGVPTLWHAGAQAGDYIWHDSTGWHFRVTHATSSRLVFTGRIVSSAPLDAVPVKLEGRDTVALSADRRVITYRLINYGHVDGFNFRTACATSLTFYGAAAGTKLPITRIWIGLYNRHPLQNPFTVHRVS